ncbi:MAG: 3'(2'),5'-bisphosphate nucleotidase CysQ [Gilvibacter sp.]
MNLLEIAISAAIDAGREIMRIYSTADFNVEIKADDSPLTIADKTANAKIMTYLEPTGVPIISEENKQTDYEVRKNWEQCWIVDPLDGTKEFIKRNGEFTVNIALIKNGTPKLGVIYVPVSKTLYFTHSEKKQSLKVVLESDSDFDVNSIIENAASITPLESLTPPIKIVGSRSHLNDDTKAFISEIEKNQPVEIVSKGSSLKFCLVAEGSAHYYPRFAPTMEWDTAAGQAICEAAGIKVIDQTTQAPLLYNRENLLNPYFLVTP